jgi:hypothetical protein
MAKITAWLVTIIGALMVLAALEVVSLADAWVTWVIALAVFVIGITKLARNYGMMKKR